MTFETSAIALPPLIHTAALAPVVLMSACAAASCLPRTTQAAAWRRLLVFCGLALLCALLPPAWLMRAPGARDAAAWSLAPGLALQRLGAWVALLVQFLGTVIGAFSSRYLQGERGQQRYVASLAAVLAGVQLLLLADHWLVLIAAWMAIGAALHRLLCFYPERPFALLAAHKKRLADRLSDLLLMAAAAVAWRDVGSGSLQALAHRLGHGPAPAALQWCAVLLVLAVVLRTALLPVHGWLIQVMEAPTPVSALLHAGVVNLGGYVLIRFAPLLEASAPARWLLVACGLGTAALAGLVSLTRVSIKVRLAWSTVAQMGFMVLECGLGLYQLAALHLLGHSLYKAHAFLSASGVVRDSRLRAMRQAMPNSAASVLAAPWVAAGVLSLLCEALGARAWPWWWTALLALAWAPLLWLPRWRLGDSAQTTWRAAAGLVLLAALGTVALLAHRLALGPRDAPWQPAGIVALAGMTLSYASLALLQLRPRVLSAWRRWNYAGFYVDEAYTRMALRLWPTRWVPTPRRRDVAGARVGIAWETK